MQMHALRSANLAKLSSSNSTSDEYCVTSISAGTPAGYCLSQIRSMRSPPMLKPRHRGGTARFWAVLNLPQPMASDQVAHLITGPTGVPSTGRLGVPRAGLRRRLGRWFRRGFRLGLLGGGIGGAL